MSALLEVRDVAVRFRGRGPDGQPRDIRALDGVDLEVDAGQVVALVGESGCGKSTLGRAIVGLERPRHGQLRFDGIDLLDLSGRRRRAIARRLQFVFQDPYASLSPRQAVGEAIAEPLAVHRLADGRRGERVRELLEEVGLDAGFGSRRPDELSGGQRQRVAIARALAVEPELVVLDEPVSALDVSIRAQVLQLLLRLRDERRLAYLMVAHDLALVRDVAERVAVMYLGRVVEEAPAAELFARPRHPYTVALIAAVPLPDPVAERRRPKLVLRGETPSPAAIPSGCRFRTRCPLAIERCATEDPVMRGVAHDHVVACHRADDVNDVESLAAGQQRTGR